VFLTHTHMFSCGCVGELHDTHHESAWGIRELVFPSTLVVEVPHRNRQNCPATIRNGALLPVHTVGGYYIPTRRSTYQREQNIKSQYRVFGALVGFDAGVDDFRFRV
jgi:hypothetical protein